MFQVFSLIVNISFYFLLHSFDFILLINILIHAMNFNSLLIKYCTVITVYQIFVVLIKQCTCTYNMSLILNSCHCTFTHALV